jgi:hypothetical protein
VKELTQHRVALQWAFTAMPGSLQDILRFAMRDGIQKKSADEKYWSGWRKKW